MECVNCGNPHIENKELMVCASCNAAVRKAERRKVAAKKPINKVSGKRRNELDQYTVLRDAFILHKWCAVHGKPCQAVDVHHMKGKVGYCDEVAEMKGIPALIDIRYWLPVCREAHNWITENSAEAIEKGYSEKRTI